MNWKSALFAVAAVAFVPGCLAPRYDRPAAPVPQQWPSGPAYPTSQPGSQPATSPCEAGQLGWDQFVTDPRLREVIGVALQTNRDLRLAALNAERTRLIFGIERARLLPIIDASAGGSRTGVPADLSRTGEPSIVDEASVDVGLTAWEIDFFGRIRNLAESARQEYLASEQAVRGAQIVLVSGVAEAYLSLGARREILDIANSTLAAQQASYELVAKRHDKGLVPELDVDRAQTQVDAARRDVARNTQLVAQDQNALNLLVGATVPDALLPEGLGSVGQLAEVSPGLSSQVLLSRPDVLEAEDRLKAMNANIGAARASLFPRVTLTTAIGTGSDELGGLFAGGSRAWVFAPQVVMPIFDPRTWYAVRVTQTDKQAAIAQYERAIQSAFREVADALAIRGTVDQQVAAQESLVRATARVYELAMARYEKGADSYLSVLDAQQSLYLSQQALVALRLVKVSGQVRLYAALGGGWR